VSLDGRKSCSKSRPHHIAIAADLRRADYRSVIRRAPDFAPAINAPLPAQRSSDFMLSSIAASSPDERNEICG